MKLGTHEAGADTRFGARRGRACAEAHASNVARCGLLALEDVQLFDMLCLLTENYTTACRPTRAPLRQPCMHVKFALRALSCPTASESKLCSAIAYLCLPCSCPGCQRGSRQRGFRETATLVMVERDVCDQ